MFKYYSSYALVLSNCTHLLCCGLPILIGLSSFTNILFFESQVFNSEILETFEIPLFLLTSTIFLFLITSGVYNKNIKCVENNDCCTEEECDSKNKRFKSNIIFSSLLYVLNSIILLSEIIS